MIGTSPGWQRYPRMSRDRKPKPATERLEDDLEAWITSDSENSPPVEYNEHVAEPWQLCCYPIEARTAQIEWHTRRDMR